MLDIQFIRDNAAAVEENARNKGATVSVSEVLKLDEQRRELIGQAEALRMKRNELSASMKGGKPDQAVIDEVKQLKTDLAEIEVALEPVETQYREQLSAIPNMASEDTPIGDSEDQNEILRTVGDKPEFSFEPKPHWELTHLVEEPRAAKISGARFAFVQGGMAQLQTALVNWGMNQLTDEAVIKKIVADAGLDVSTKPFTAMLPPMMMRTEAYAATARLKPDDVTFKLANDDLWLTGSSEHSMCAYYMNDQIPEAELPVRFVGYNAAFRREVGSAGQDTRGILRVHHFNKLEMESFAAPEDSRKEHEFMIAVQEYLNQQLELPYQLVLKCTFDMGGPNARGVDIETWMPGQGKFRETHSADYITDYQARGLQTKIAPTDASKLKPYAHTNDATALADRTLIAIVENYQNEDGSIRVPRVLQSYLNGREVV